MSCSCNNSYYNLPCCCPPVPVGTTTTTTTTVCPDAIPCEEAYQSDCIIYHGPDIPCYGIKTGDSVTDIINIIIAQLNPCTTTTTSTTTTTTQGPTTTSTTTETTSTTTEAPTTTTTAAPTFKYTLDVNYSNCNGYPSPNTNYAFSVESLTPLPQFPNPTDIYIIHDYPNLGDTLCFNITVASAYNGIDPTYPVTLAANGCADCPFPVPSGLFQVQNNTANGNISNFSNASGYALSGGGFPAGPGQLAVGSHPPYPIGTSGTLTVDSPGSVSVYKNGVLLECTDVPNVPGIFTVSFGPLTEAFLSTDDFLITYDDIPCTTITTTTTSTTTLAPTTSTTTSAPTNKSVIILDNFTTTASVTNIIINSVDQLTLLQQYPIGPTNGSNGQYNTGIVDVTVFFSGLTGSEVITLVDSYQSTSCISLSAGQLSTTFIGKILDDSLSICNFSITLKPGPC